MNDGHAGQRTPIPRWRSQWRLAALDAVVFAAAVWSGEPASPDSPDAWRYPAIPLALGALALIVLPAMKGWEHGRANGRRGLLRYARRLALVPVAVLVVAMVAGTLAGWMHFAAWDFMLLGFWPLLLIPLVPTVLLLMLPPLVGGLLGMRGAPGAGKRHAA